MIAIVAASAVVVRRTSAADPDLRGRGRGIERDVHAAPTCLLCGVGTGGNVGAATVFAPLVKVGSLGSWVAGSRPQPLRPMRLSPPSKREFGDVT